MSSPEQRPVSDEIWGLCFSPPENRRIIRSKRKHDWTEFLRSGTTIARVLLEKLSAHGIKLDADQRVLDFGCGAGRVLLPLQDHTGHPGFACDINVEQIRYLRGQVPRLKARATGYSPPLHYNDGFFDAIYSISVWTHLPKEHQLLWLTEMRRILAPGGLLLLTVSGETVLRTRHLRPADTCWEDVGPETLASAGFLHRDYHLGDMGKAHQALADIAEGWGRTLQSELHTRTHFDPILPILEYLPGMIGGVQDLVIMRKPA